MEVLKQWIDIILKNLNSMNFQCSLLIKIQKQIKKKYIINKNIKTVYNKILLFKDQLVVLILKNKKN